MTSGSKKLSRGGCLQDDLDPRPHVVGGREGRVLCSKTLPAAEGKDEALDAGGDGRGGDGGRNGTLGRQLASAAARTFVRVEGAQHSERSAG
jgi:hypothetical protein